MEGLSVGKKEAVLSNNKLNELYRPCMVSTIDNANCPLSYPTQYQLLFLFLRTRSCDN